MKRSIFALILIVVCIPMLACGKKKKTAPPNSSTIIINNSQEPTAQGRSSQERSSSARASSDDQMELEMWKSVKNSNNRADLEAYLDEYPNGKFARLANNRLDSLRSGNRNDR